MCFSIGLIFSWIWGRDRTPHLDCARFIYFNVIYAFQWEFNASHRVEHHHRSDCIHGDCRFRNDPFSRLAGCVFLGDDVISGRFEQCVSIQSRSHSINSISIYVNFHFKSPVAGGIYQNSVYGMAAKLPFKYTGAVVLGSNISGTLTSIISILTSFFASSVKTAAIYYFIGAMFVLLACFDTYFALPLNVSSAIRPHIEIQ